MRNIISDDTTKNRVDERDANDVVISVRDVTKWFKLYNNVITGPLKEFLIFWKRRAYYRTFPAVKDVCLDIRRGEVVGLIGANGAGKTTLLKMIAGLLTVDEGTIDVRGKVTALLALGVGVHPEFTGRENIYYSGLLLGMSAEEVRRKISSIIEFSELGEFIDQPFRTYSSGMRARLLFSISMSIDPDILIIDEALATGDARFVSKSAQRVREICRSGATVLFVSHNMLQIQDLCQRVVLMEGGRILAQGDPREMVAIYNEHMFTIERNSATVAKSKIERISGTGGVSICAARLLDADGRECTGIYTGESATLELDYECHLEDGIEVTFFAGIERRSDGRWVGEISTNHFVDAETGKVSHATLSLGTVGTIRVKMKPMLLLNGHYSFWIVVCTPRENFCEYRQVAPFFAGRRSNVFDREPVFWQPCGFEGTSVSKTGEIRALVTGDFANIPQDLTVQS